MEFAGNGKCGCEWGMIPSQSRRSVLSWMEDRFGDEFLHGLCNVNGNGRLSENGNLDSILEGNFSLRLALSDLVVIMTLHDPVELELPHVVGREGKTHLFQSYDRRWYPDKVSRNEADNEFKRFFKVIYNEMKDELPHGDVELDMHYTIANHPYGRHNVYPDESKALSECLDVSKIYSRAWLYGTITDDIDFGRMDFHKENRISFSRKEYLGKASEIGCEFKDTPYYGRLVDFGYNEEFGKLLKEL